MDINQITLEEEDLIKLSDILEFLNAPARYALIDKFGYESSKEQDLQRHVTYLRRLLALAIPSTFTDERCCFSGCSHCDTREAELMHELLNAYDDGD